MIVLCALFQICRSAGNREGEAYLLDRAGDTAGALQTLLDGLDDSEHQVSRPGHRQGRAGGGGHAGRDIVTSVCSVMGVAGSVT